MWWYGIFWKLITGFQASQPHKLLNWYVSCHLCTGERNNWICKLLVLWHDNLNFGYKLRIAKLRSHTTITFVKSKGNFCVVINILAGWWVGSLSSTQWCNSKFHDSYRFSLIVILRLYTYQTPESILGGMNFHSTINHLQEKSKLHCNVHFGTWLGKVENG